MKKIVVITGQTAAGKSSYAWHLADQINGELINADSRQIYKKLDIITGKDIGSEKDYVLKMTHDKLSIGYYIINGIKLWLYDLVDPKEYFSSFDFVRAAKIAIDDILKNKKIPIIVGGSYLYIKHLLYGFETETIPPDWGLRERLSHAAVSQLQQILSKLDQEALNGLNESDINNPHRLIRKIEIAEFRQNTAGPKSVKKLNRLSDHENEKWQLEKYIGLSFAKKEKMKQIIEARVQDRVKIGAFAEVEALLKAGYRKIDPGLKTIGYKEIIAFYEGVKTENEAIADWVTAEMQYAKRQATFMKKDKNITWIKI